MIDFYSKNCYETIRDIINLLEGKNEKILESKVEERFSNLGFRVSKVGDFFILRYPSIKRKLIDFYHIKDSVKYLPQFVLSLKVIKNEETNLFHYDILDVDRGIACYSAVYHFCDDGCVFRDSYSYIGVLRIEEDINATEELNNFVINGIDLNKSFNENFLLTSRFESLKGFKENLLRRKINDGELFFKFIDENFNLKKVK